MDGQQEDMNWGAVEDQLSGIQDVWKEPRFDTLPHVVAVLTSGYPQDDITSLARLRDTIEVLVDDVVQIYHVGFNKAIHNYSQILKLFSESAEQMSELKTSLAEARRLLSNRHKQLQQLWCRSITLRHIISLIDQIDSVSKVPARIDQLVSEGQLYAAVQIHLQSLSTLEREGISSIGALRDIRTELANTKLLLFNRVIEELHAHLYNKGRYSPKAEVTTEDDDDVSNLVPVPVSASAPLHPSLASQGVSLPVQARTNRRGRSARQRATETGSVISEDDDGTPSSPTRSETSATSSAPAGDLAGRRQHVVPPKWLAEATSNEFVESLTKRDAPDHIKYMQTLVECVGLLGKVAAAGAVLSQRVRGTVREIILNEIKEFAAAAEAARPRVEQVGKRSSSSSPLSSSLTLSSTPRTHASLSSTHLRGTGSKTMADRVAGAAAAAAAVERGGANGGGAGGGGGGGGGSVGVGGGAVALHAPNGLAQVTAQEVLESIMKKLTLILENHIVAGELMEARASDRSSDVRRTPDGDEAVSKFSASTGGYSVAFVWSCMQSECQQLLCDILRANPDGGSSETSGRSSQLRLDSSGSKGPMLTFSFRFTDASSGAGAAAPSEPLSAPPKRRGGGPSGPLEGYGTCGLLTERGIYLASACYRPTLQFTEKVCQMLPRKYADLGRSGLRPFMDSFVKDQFLPAVRDDYRSRVAEALSSPSAFRPRAKSLGTYESSVSKGRPLLQGPMAVEGVVEEVLEWAKAMPVYASELIALVHVLLDRTLERCRAVYTEAVLGSLSSALIGRPDMDNLMQQQAAARLLSETDLSSSELEASREDPPLDSEAYELDLEIYGKLFALRPVKEEQLILDMGKLVVLAALSDTLEYFADAILRLGRPKPPPGYSKKTSAASARQRPPALTSSLQRLSEKYRQLAREALRTLRVEMQLHCLFHLQFMPTRSYMNDIDAEEPEDFIVALTAQLTRVDEEMTVYIAAPRRYYVFGGVCSLAATGLIKALSELHGINSLGVRQVQRNCIALQQTLATLNANGSQSVQLSLDRVGEYYELLNRPYEALLAYVKDHNRYFTYEEYITLLKVKVPGRHVPPDAAATIKELLQEG